MHEPGTDCFVTPGFNPVYGWQEYLTACASAEYSRQQDEEIAKIGDDYSI